MFQIFRHKSQQKLKQFSPSPEICKAMLAHRSLYRDSSATNVEFVPSMKEIETPAHAIDWLKLKAPAISKSTLKHDVLMQNETDCTKCIRTHPQT